MMVKRILSSNVKNMSKLNWVKDRIEEETQRLAEHSVRCSDLIEKLAKMLIRDGMTVLVHSYSKCVIQVLKSARDRGIRINVICTESMPFNSGIEIQKEMDRLRIPCKTVLDSSVGLIMHQVDCVFVGSEAVLENGGIVNRLGTYTIAICAKQYSKPLYVFSESLKFLKFFPLQQSDIFNIVDNVGDEEEELDISKMYIDYTPPEYISELFTDIGIFTPAAVSDELIKFFQA